jgi:hypothetical protein
MGGVCKWERGSFVIGGAESLCDIILWCVVEACRGVREVLSPSLAFLGRGHKVRSSVRR